jgi:hypothetical protein
MNVPKKDAAQLVQTSASNSDIEDGIVGTTYEVKRDLGRRHINMIAIAGMIVGGTFFELSCASVLTRTNSRAPGYFWHLVRQSPPQDQSALSSGTSVWD